MITKQKSELPHSIEKEKLKVFLGYRVGISDITAKWSEVTLAALVEQMMKLDEHDRF